jgi:hypothetical protein
MKPKKPKSRKNNKKPTKPKRDSGDSDTGDSDNSDSAVTVGFCRQSWRWCSGDRCDGGKEWEGGVGGGSYEFRKTAKLRRRTNLANCNSSETNQFGANEKLSRISWKTVKKTTKSKLSRNRFVGINRFCIFKNFRLLWRIWLDKIWQIRRPTPATTPKPIPHAHPPRNRRGIFRETLFCFLMMVED